MAKRKRLFDIEIHDTNAPPTRQLVWRGTKIGNYPREALRKTTKMFPKINFAEPRRGNPKHGRYVFIYGEAK